MPRPAYIAAHSPAGPAPTMITSYPSLAVSFIGPQFSVRPPQLQPRRFGIAGKRSLELRTKPNRFDLDIGSLPARQLFERAPAHSNFSAPWQLEIVPTNAPAAEPLSPAARTSASPASTASTAKVPTPNTW